MKMGYGSHEVIVRLQADQDGILSRLAAVIEKAEETATEARKLMEEIREGGVEENEGE